MTRYRCPTCGYVYDEEKRAGSGASCRKTGLVPVCGEAGPSFEPVGPEAEKPVRSALGKVAMAHRVSATSSWQSTLCSCGRWSRGFGPTRSSFRRRTVVHMSLGMAIGVILFLKIAIVRFFRRLDAASGAGVGHFALGCQRGADWDRGTAGLSRSPGHRPGVRGGEPSASRGTPAADRAGRGPECLGWSPRSRFGPDNGCSASVASSVTTFAPCLPNRGLPMLGGRPSAAWPTAPRCSNH